MTPTLALGITAPGAGEVVKLANAVGLLQKNLASLAATSGGSTVNNLSSISGQLTRMRREMAVAVAGIRTDLAEAFATAAKTTKTGGDKLADETKKAAAKVRLAAQSINLGGGLKASISGTGLDSAGSVRKLAAEVAQSGEAISAAADAQARGFLHYKISLMKGSADIAQAQQQAALTRLAAQAKASSAYATTNAVGSYSSIQMGSYGQVRDLKAVPSALDDIAKKARPASVAMGGLTNTMADAHSAARGLASGFGLLWLTWGNLVPLLAGAAVSHGFVQMIKMGAEVQNTFTQIRVLAGASADETQRLNAQMLDMARNGQYGPSQIATAMKTLSLAGLDAKQVYSSVRDVLNFAIAGDATIEKSADVLTSVATAFNVSAENYAYVGDTIAKAAAESKSSVEGMGEAFKTASVIHQQYGVSLEDTAVGLALLANAGINNTAAGTAMRNMYADLAGRTPKVQKALDALRVQTLDPLTGKLRDTEMIFRDLMVSLQTRAPKDQFKFIQDIFSERGGKEAIAILNAMKQKGQDVGSVYDDLKAKVLDSAGFTARAAAEMALTPLNQMKSVAASLQATLVEVFESMQPAVLDFANQLKSAFQNEEFKTSIKEVAVAFGNLILLMVEHGKTIATVLLSYAAFKGAVGVLAAVSAATTAWAAATTTAVTAVGLVTRAATVANPLMLALAGLVTVGATAWAAYQLWAGKSKEKLDEFSASNNGAELLKRLADEEERLTKVNEARAEGISLMELEARIQGAKLKEQTTPEVAAARKALADFDNGQSGKTIFGLDTWRTNGINRSNEMVKERKELVDKLAKAELSQFNQSLEIEKYSERISALRKQKADEERERMVTDAKKHANPLGLTEFDEDGKPVPKGSKVKKAFNWRDDWKGNRESWLQEYDAEQARLNKGAEEQKARDEAAAKSHKAYTESIEKQVLAVRESAYAEQLAFEMRGKSKSQIEELRLLRLEEARESELGFLGGSAEELRLLDAQIAAQRQKVTRTQHEELLDLNDKAAKEAEAQWKQVGNSLVDNLMQGGKSVRDYLKDLFRTLVLRPILQPVGVAMAAGVQSVLGFGANGGTGGGILSSLGSSILGKGATSLLSASLGTGLTGTMGGTFGAGLMGGLGVGGTGYSLSGGLSLAAELGATAGGAGALLGTLAPWLAGAYALSEIFGSKGGPKTEGGADMAASIGTQYAEIAGALGLKNKATFEAFYSKDPEGDSLSQLRIAAFSNGQHVYERPGEENVGRSEAEFNAEVSRATFSAITAALKAGGLDQSFVDYLRAIPSDAAEEVRKEALATVVAVSQLTKAMQELGGPFTVIGTLSVDARKNLIDLAGSVENFAGLSSNFLSKYYTEAEQQNFVWKRLTQTFHEANVVLPSTVASYRQLYESQDLTTEAGRRNAVMLLQNADAFATLYSNASKLEDATSATDAAMSVLERSVEKQRKLLTTQRDAAQSLVDELKSIFDVLDSAIKGLYSEVAPVVQSQATAGQQFIDQALSMAQSSGVLPDADELSSAIDAARQGIAGQQFTTQADADFARLVLAGKLNSMKDISDRQLTTAEQSLKYLEDQLNALDTLVSQYQEQITTMREGDLSIVAAISNLAAAIAVERSMSPGTSGGSSGAASVVEGLYQSMLGRASDPQGLSYWSNRLATGESLSSVTAAMQASAEYVNRMSGSLASGVPQLAMGTNYVPQDMFAFLHKGESVVPAQYNASHGADPVMRGLLDKIYMELDAMREAQVIANLHMFRTAEAVNGNPEAPMLAEIVT